MWAFIRKQAIRPVIYAVGGDDGHDDRNPYRCARPCCPHQPSQITLRS